jgi:4'-phosphopantetheinyl transferase
LTHIQRVQLCSWITADEDRKRSRFHRLEDADRFLVGRATLRRELGRRLDMQPQDVPLELGEHSKPFVAGGPHVNVSHSGDVVLVAVSSGAPVGVDVERIDPRAARELEHANVFAARETDELAQLPDALRVNAFFHIWTAREAIMKLAGAGFDLPRDSFSVSVDPRLPPRLTSTQAPLAPDMPRSLVSLDVPDGYVAALAVAAEPDAFRVEVIADPFLGPDTSSRSGNRPEQLENK